MKVILLCNIPGKGFKGDVIDVSDGYARNFLFPEACAVAATEEALLKRKAEEEKAKKEAKAASKAAEAAAEALDGVEVIIAEKANEDGTLYGAVSKKDIVAAVKKAGFKLTEEAIADHEPMKEVGTRTLTAEFPGGFEAEFRLIIEGVVDDKKRKNNEDE